jgi:hypothetical protein
MSFLILITSFTLTAQPWNFRKEKDGIKIYTREEAGKTLKSYRGIADINAPADKVYSLMEDVNHTEWWDKNLTQIKVLLYEKNKRAQYYLVYDLPWPVIDRDLCVDVTIKTNPVTGEKNITAVPITGVVPEQKDRVRIKDYLQTWTIIPSGENKTHVVLEGFVDPAGNIPEWISNMLIVESPVRAISGVKDQLEREK